MRLQQTVLDLVRMTTKTRWETELEREGWTVVPGVLTTSELNTCLELTWDWLESLGSGIERLAKVSSK